jgi:hypothetical protein
MGNRVSPRRKHLPNPRHWGSSDFRRFPTIGERSQRAGKDDGIATSNQELSQDIFDGCTDLLVDQRLKVGGKLHCNTTTNIMDIEHLSLHQLRRLSRQIRAIVRRDLRFAGVAGNQIIRALLKECNLNFASGFVYAVLQGAANEARRRGLLINPNPHDRSDGYSAAVGNTQLMFPSMGGWEMTKGILIRHLHNATNYVDQVIGQVRHAKRENLNTK